MGIEPGSIVQLDPYATENKAFSGCLMVVDKVYPWGVQGYVQDLGKNKGEEEGGVAYYRAKHGTFEDTGGRARWVLFSAKDEQEEE